MSLWGFHTCFSLLFYFINPHFLQVEGNGQRSVINIFSWGFYFNVLYHLSLWPTLLFLKSPIRFKKSKTKKNQ